MQERRLKGIEEKVSTLLNSRVALKVKKDRRVASKNIYLFVKAGSIFMSAVGIASFISENLPIEGLENIIKILGLFIGVIGGYSIASAQTNIFNNLKEKFAWFLMLVYIAILIMDTSIMSSGAVASYKFIEETKFLKYKTINIKVKKEDAIRKRELLSKQIEDIEREKNIIMKDSPTPLDTTNINKQIQDLKDKIEADYQAQKRKINKRWATAGAKVYFKSARSAHNNNKLKRDRRLKKEVSALSKKLKKQLKKEKKSYTLERDSTLKKVRELNRNLKKIEDERALITIPTLSAPNVEINYFLVVASSLFVSLILSLFDSWRIMTQEDYETYVKTQTTRIKNELLGIKPDEVKENPRESHLQNNKSQDVAFQIINKSLEEGEMISAGKLAKKLNISKTGAYNYIVQFKKNMEFKTEENK